MTDRWVSAAERIIEDGQRRGAFDDLPGRGAPIAGLDAPHDPDWWAKRFVARERARDRRDDAVAAARRLKIDLAAVADEGDVRRLVADCNAELRAADCIDAPVPTGAFLDVDAVVADWRSRRGRRRPWNRG